MLSCIYRCLLALLTLPLFVACSSLKDTAEPPAELTEIEREVRLDTLWRKDTGKGSDEFLLNLQPLVDGDRVFTSDYRGRVSAYNKLTGKREWKVGLNQSISTTFGASDNALYLGTRDGELLALAKRDGALLWTAELTGEALAPPVSAFGVVLVRVSDGSLHGLSEATGETLWTNRRSVPNLTLRGTSTPIVEGGRAIVGMDNGRLLALSVLDGRVMWEAPLGVPQGRTELQRMTDIDVMPVLDGGLVYASAYQGRIAAVSAETGRLLWSREISSHHDVAMDDEGSLYVRDENSQLWGLDKRNGATLWVQDKLRARHLTAPVVRGEYILVADLEGFVHVLSTADGRLVGRKQYNGEPYLTSAVIDEERIYWMDTEGELSVFQLEAEDPA